MSQWIRWKTSHLAGDIGWDGDQRVKCERGFTNGQGGGRIAEEQFSVQAKLNGPVAVLQNHSANMSVKLSR